MQILFISNRPALLRETFAYVEAFMPFIDEGVLIVPGSMRADFVFRSTIPIQIVPEETILGDHLPRFRTCRDHVMKNWLLRSSLPAYRNLGDEFIMADDDNRPLVPITKEFYLSEGKYESYYYDDMKYRIRDVRKYPPYTSYDHAQIETYHLLQKKNYDTRTYSSHMPQIINRAFLQQAVETFFHEEYTSLDEWNIYFNFAHRHYPTRFHKPKPYMTLCWPMRSAPRDRFVRPRAFCFENFYPHLYQKGQVFAGIPTSFDSANHPVYMVEKVKRRLKQDVDSALCPVFRALEQFVKYAVKRGLSLWSKSRRG